jgi:hypothetical protein
VNHVPSHAIELEIMHHFTIRTWQTCDAATFPATFWQESMPLMAMQHDYLLFALMSFTCLHMAFLRIRNNPGDPNGDAARFTALALSYRDRTLKILPTLFDNPSRDQAEACFWASALIGLIGLATYTTPGARESSAKAQLLQVCQLWRGTATIGAVYAPVVGEGYAESFNPIPEGMPTGTQMGMIDHETPILLPTVHSPGDDINHRQSATPRGSVGSEHGGFPLISPIVGTPVANDIHPISPASHLDLDLQFEAKILQLRQFIVNTLLPNAKLTPLLNAIDDFSKALVLYKTMGSESGLMAWGPRQSIHFIDAFKRGDQNASLIMIFYGVGLHLVRHVWYVSDLGAKLVAELVPLFEKDLVLAAAAANGAEGVSGVGAEPDIGRNLEAMELDGVGMNAGHSATEDSGGIINGAGADHGVNGIETRNEVTCRVREKAALIQWAREQVAS